MVNDTAGIARDALAGQGPFPGQHVSRAMLGRFLGQLAALRGCEPWRSISQPWMGTESIIGPDGGGRLTAMH